MAGVQRQELTLVQAADLLGLGYRQTKRVWRRYQAQGDAGLVHRLRGQPSARREPPALRAQVLARYEDERYADFGPTLLAEHLTQEGLEVDQETVRRWLLAAGKSTGNGANASRAWGRWCSWTAPTTTGWRGGGRPAS